MPAGAAEEGAVHAAHGERGAADPDLGPPRAHAARGLHSAGAGCCHLCDAGVPYVCTWVLHWVRHDWPFSRMCTVRLHWCCSEAPARQLVGMHVPLHGSCMEGHTVACQTRMHSTLLELLQSSCNICGPDACRHTYVYAEGLCRPQHAICIQAATAELMWVPLCRRCFEHTPMPTVPSAAVQARHPGPASRTTPCTAA